MALTRLTQLTGQSGISTTIDYTMSDLVVDTISVGGTITYNDVTSVDSIGIITARKGIQILGDGINVTGISTFNNDVTFKGATSGRDATWDNSDNRLHFAGLTRIRMGENAQKLDIYNDNANTNFITSSATNLRILSDITRIRKGNNENYILCSSSSVKLYNSDVIRLKTTGTGVEISDDLNVAGIATVAGIIDANGGANISGGAGLVADTAKISDLTDNRVVVAGTGGELEDSGNLTFDGSTLLVTGTLNSTVDVQINGTSVADTALNDAVAMAIALG